MARAGIHYSMGESEFISVELEGPAKSPDQLYDLKERAVEMFRSALALSDEAEGLDREEFNAMFAEADTEE